MKWAYLNEQSRHVDVVKAEYSLMMARQVDGDLWWI